MLNKGTKCTKLLEPVNRLGRNHLEEEFKIFLRWDPAMFPRLPFNSWTQNHLRLLSAGTTGLQYCAGPKQYLAADLFIFTVVK